MIRALSDELPPEPAVSMFDGIERVEWKVTDEAKTVTTEANTDRRRWLALYVLCGGMLMIVLDATIVNVALPSIKDDLASRRATWPGWSTPT